MMVEEYLNKLSVKSCPLRSSCQHFDEKASHCKNDDHSDCSRYTLCKVIGSVNIPDSLSPDDKAQAQKVLEQILFEENCMEYIHEYIDEELLLKLGFHKLIQHFNTISK